MEGTRLFAMVELLSTCPTNWGMDASRRRSGWLEDNMIPYYPLGVFKDTMEDA